ncbi:MAG TPA: family 16 glycoside hydrolase, partial [Chitinophagaceae bacterium]|nr:family 16 glycoside hydrolase [Chitinophagaceae bacterium]
MKNIITGLFLLIAISCLAQKRSQSGKWIKLFNGKNLKGWTVKIKDHPVNDNWSNTFRVENGVMKVSYDQYDGFKEQFGHIFYKKKFSAYLLVVEYRFTGEQVKGGPGWALRNSG